MKYRVGRRDAQSVFVFALEFEVAERAHEHSGARPDERVRAGEAKLPARGRARFIPLLRRHREHLRPKRMSAQLSLQQRMPRGAAASGQEGGVPTSHCTHH